MLPTGRDLPAIWVWDVRPSPLLPPALRGGGVGTAEGESAGPRLLGVEVVSSALGTFCAGS